MNLIITGSLLLAISMKDLLYLVGQLIDGVKDIYITMMQTKINNLSPEIKTSPKAKGFYSP